MSYQAKPHTGNSGLITRQRIAVGLCFALLLHGTCVVAQPTGIFDKIKMSPDKTAEQPKTPVDAGPQSDSRIPPPAVSPPAEEQQAQEIDSNATPSGQAPTIEAPFKEALPEKAPETPETAETTAPRSEPSVAEPPKKAKALKPLAALREAMVQSLQEEVDEEVVMMRANVKRLTREQAVVWLSSFISSPPLSCPAHARDRWIEAIINASMKNNVPLCKEFLGLLACIISIESGFHTDPPMVDPSKKEGMAELVARVETEFHHKLGNLFYIPPIPGLYAEYKAKYYPLLLECKSEGQVDALAKFIAADLKRDTEKLPEFARRLIDEHLDKLSNVIHTKGSMQLNFNRAKHVMARRGAGLDDQELTDYMYTPEGGVDVGAAALKPMFIQYAAYFATSGDLSWLYYVGMDYHYGPFTSRNMMEQIRIRDLSGRDVTVDGDLLFYDDDGDPMDQISQTLRAARAMFPLIPKEKILAAFSLEKDPHYIYTRLHRRIRLAHRSKFGDTPFAVIGELWMGREAEIKHGKTWNTHTYLNKLNRYLNSIPWDFDAY